MRIDWKGKEASSSSRFEILIPGWRAERLNKLRPPLPPTPYLPLEHFHLAELFSSACHSAGRDRVKRFYTSGFL
jgi:hypothetical protein